MKLAVRRVSVNDDREQILEVLNRNFGAGQGARFHWRHIDNPAGEAWCWVVYDGNNAVATAAVFPRRMFVDGKEQMCGQVGDFAVDASYRSLGPALLLQRTTFEPVDSGAITFCYDCPPHNRGMSTFARLGMNPSCEITRYALALKSDEFLERRLGGRAWTKPVVAAANLFLARRITSRPIPGLEITALDGAFGDDFSELDGRVSSLGTIRASRSAEVLNWRYLENPALQTRTLVARQSGELVGFVTFCINSGSAHILELFGIQPAVIEPPLLEAAINLCSKEDVSSVWGFCSEQSELRPLFTKAGFRPREVNGRVVAYEKSGERALLTHGLRWSFGQLEVMT